MWRHNSTRNLPPDSHYPALLSSRNDSIALVGIKPVGFASFCHVESWNAGIVLLFVYGHGMGGYVTRSFHISHFLYFFISMRNLTPQTRMALFFWLIRFQMRSSIKIETSGPWFSDLGPSNLSRFQVGILHTFHEMPASSIIWNILEGSRYLLVSLFKF